MSKHFRNWIKVRLFSNLLPKIGIGDPLNQLVVLHGYRMENDPCDKR